MFITVLYFDITVEVYWKVLSRTKETEHLLDLLILKLAQFFNQDIKLNKFSSLVLLMSIYI